MSNASATSRYWPAPEKTCDIVMKGGITSGIVYPRALCEIAKQYRFVNIGGTSAGAMAAAAVAAAEYGRDKGGFERLQNVPDDVGADLLGLFQPDPRVTPLFNIFLAMLKGGNALTRTLRAIGAAMIGYYLTTIAGVLVGYFTAAALVIWTGGDQKALFVFGLTFAFATLFLFLILRIYWALTHELPRTDIDFGLCSGRTMNGAKRKAFTDWLNALINELAGRKETDRPLTFGDIAPDPDDPAITLKMMTTSLMERRPYSLPLESGHGFLFKKEEWERLFPENVMNHLCKLENQVLAPEGEFYPFPDAADLPLVVAARMSLSFPLLIAAVPLWRKDSSYRSAQDMQRLRRCLFSDGGLSSNFPIHFFDGLLPRRPTFAISLEDYNPDKNYRPAADNDPNTTPPMHWMSDLHETTPKLPVQDFNGLLGFMLRLVDSAKDWQDNLQSLLPGYRERIVYVGLEGHEGGLNVTMPQPVVDGLAARGEAAAQQLVAEFEDDAKSRRWNEHRWRRFLVAQARLGGTLGKVSSILNGETDGWAEFLTQPGYPDEPNHFRQSEETLAEFRKRSDGLAELCKDWDDLTPLNPNLPQPDTDLRVTPKP